MSVDNVRNEAPVGTTKKLLRRLWSWYLNASPLVVVTLALILGLIIGGVVITATTSTILKAWGGFFDSWNGPFHALNVNFSSVFDAYRAMFTGSLVDPPAFWRAVTSGNGWTGPSSVLTPLSETLTYATPLIIASVGVGIGFQTGVFNIGANGQAMAGGIIGTAVGSMIHVVWFVHFPLTIAAGLLGGAIAGLIPGLLKAYSGAHEVIVTIMLNYVILYVMGYLLLSSALEQPGSFDGVSRTIDTGAQLPTLFGPSSGLRVNYGLFIAVAVVVGAWWFLDRSTLGFDFRVTGANPDAALTAGINPKVVLVSVFAISGGLAGLAGITQVAGVSHYIDNNFLVGSAGIGFTAITVSLLGQNRPFGIVWGSLLFAALDVGGRAMQGQTGIPFDLATVIQAVIVLLVATPALIKQVFHLRSIRSGTITIGTKGWG